MNQCIAAPISWLRLERYGLGELPAAERSELERHLASCPVCRACFDTIAARADVELPGLPPTAARPRRPSWLGWPVLLGGFGSALAALALFLSQPGDGPGLEPPSSHLRVKGGELAIELVRLDAQGRQLVADRFDPSDRFKILLTCPAALRAHADAVVYQSGQVYFPLAAQALESCGNRRALEGAFQLDGQDPALVCVAITQDAPPARPQLATGIGHLPKLSVCTRVNPR